jgi:uncharacterized ferritin-like protein (DUF455 family)
VKAALARCFATSHRLDRSDVRIDEPRPARPPGRPRVGPAKDVPTRFAVHHGEGRAALLHCDRAHRVQRDQPRARRGWRFAGMPPTFYRDWLRVASEEALHFTLLREHLLAWASTTATSTRTTACGR